MGAKVDNASTQVGGRFVHLARGRWMRTFWSMQLPFKRLIPSKLRPTRFLRWTARATGLVWAAWLVWVAGRDDGEAGWMDEALPPKEE